MSILLGFPLIHGPALATWDQVPTGRETRCLRVYIGQGAQEENIEPWNRARPARPERYASKKDNDAV